MEKPLVTKKTETTEEDMGDGNIKVTTKIVTVTKTGNKTHTATQINTTYKSSAKKPSSTKPAAPKKGSSSAKSAGCTYKASPEAIEFAKRVLEEQNLARTNPKGYIPKISKVLGYMKGNCIYYPGDPVGHIMNEGPAAYKEAIAFLEKQKPLPALKWCEGLAKAAFDHSSDIGVHGIAGHVGSNGCSMTDRMDRYGQWESGCGENVSFGMTDPELIVRQLLVDEGVPSRGHRKNMFSDTFTV